MGKFTHLHVHSHYSVLDGMCSVSGLVERCQELGMNALALTDHGVMYGIREFYDCVKGANNKIKDEIEKLKKELATAENDDIRASLEKPMPKPRYSSLFLGAKPMWLALHHQIPTVLAWWCPAKKI